METLTILSLNIQFLNMASREEMEEYLYDNSDGVDVMLLQEVLSTQPIRVEGFKRAASCNAEKLNGSPGYLMNLTLVRKGLKTKKIGSFSDTKICPTKRCLLVVEVGGIRIANVHLCGGRYDDENFEKAIDSKENELHRLVDKFSPDIVAGDFNGEPIKVPTKYDLYKNLDRAGKKLYKQYYSSGHSYLKEQGYTRVASKGITSVYGGTPDWFYYDSGVLKNKGMKKLMAIRDEYSDHNGLIAKFEVRD